MATYHIHFETLGFQAFETEAKSPEDALSKIKSDWASETPIAEEIEPDWSTVEVKLKDDSP